MTDILSAVYDYVLKYACDVSNDINPYTENQIVRGWQNSATLPPNTNEFCIITDLTTSAHGTTSEFFDSDNVCQLQRTIEHVIQIDFLSSEGITLPQTTLRRATAIQTVSNTNFATDFFQTFDSSLTCLYADGVTNLSELDESKTYSTRYQVQLHLAEIFTTTISADTFSNVDLHIENVDVHHKT